MPLYYTRGEVLRHDGSSSDCPCWVICRGAVLDVSDVVRDLRHPHAATLLAHAGGDVTHLVADDGELATTGDAATGLRVPLATTRLPAPEVLSATPYAEWWRDAQRVVGRLTASEHRLLLVNLLTTSEEVVSFTAEETLGAVKTRFEAVNAAARRAYAWRIVGGPLGPERLVDESRTAAGNGLGHSAVKELEAIGLTADVSANLPIVMLQFAAPAPS